MFEASKEFLELTFREEEARGNYPARGPGPCPVAENVRSARTGRRAVKWVGLLSQSSLKLRAAWCPILAPIQIELVACIFSLFRSHTQARAVCRIKTTTVCHTPQEGPHRGGTFHFNWR